MREQIEAASATDPEEADSTDIFCECDSAGAISGTTVGIRVEFWEPTRVFEVVKDAWCFPMLGQNSEGGMAANDNKTALTQTKDGTQDSADDEIMQRQV